MNTIEVNNRIEWDRAKVSLGQQVQIKGICGIFIGEEQPHKPTNHSHNYWDPILLVMDEKGYPKHKVIFYDDFHMRSKVKITGRDDDICRYNKFMETQK